MARTLFATVLCLVIAWALMLSYQIFSQPALTTLATSLVGSVPLVAAWINSGMDSAVFVFSFAWMFVFSSIIQTLMFGNERRLTIQFLVSLGLTLLGSTILGAIGALGLDLSAANLISSPLAALFGNVFFAVFYLALPFIVMLTLDIWQMRK